MRAAVRIKIAMLAAGTAVLLVAVIGLLQGVRLSTLVVRAAVSGCIFGIGGLYLGNLIDQAMRRPSQAVQQRAGAGTTVNVVLPPEEGEAGTAGAAPAAEQPEAFQPFQAEQFRQVKTPEQ